MEQQDPEEERTTAKLKDQILQRQDSLRLKSIEEGKAFISANHNDTIDIAEGLSALSNSVGDTYPRRFRAGSSIGQIFPRVRHKMKSPLNSRRNTRSLGSQTKSKNSDTSDFETDGSFDISDVSDFERYVEFLYFNFLFEDDKY